MEAAQKHGQTGDEMMAGPGNALARRTTPAPEAPQASDPEAEMERLMRETGYQGNDPAEGMAHVWKAMPTDDVAELIDVLAKKHGLPTPFDQSGGKMKLGGPTDDLRQNEIPKPFDPSELGRPLNRGSREDYMRVPYDEIPGLRDAPQQLEDQSPIKRRNALMMRRA